jgi:hypothetical protein
MQRKRVVHILILCIILATPLASFTLSVAFTEISISTVITPEFVEISNTAQLNQDNFTINCPSEPITWCKDSKTNLIIWTITNNTLDAITFDVLRNGTIEYSGMAEHYSFLQSIPVFYSVPILEMDFGTYNYTLVATGSVEIKSATVILNLVEGTANTANPLLDALAFIALIGGFTVLYFATFLGLSSLNRYFGGMKHIES